MGGGPAPPTLRTSADSSSAALEGGRVKLTSVDNWQEQAARNKTHQIALAVAEREQGRRRLNATTVTVGLASVAVAGVVVAVLPGASHAATQSSSSSGSSSTSGSDGSSTGSSSDSTSQGGFQAPASAPQVVTGGGGFSSTSGGT